MNFIRRREVDRPAARGTIRSDTLTYVRDYTRYRMLVSAGSLDRIASGWSFYLDSYAGYPDSLVRFLVGAFRLSVVQHCCILAARSPAARTCYFRYLFRSQVGVRIRILATDSDVSDYARKYNCVIKVVTRISKLRREQSLRAIARAEYSCNSIPEAFLLH